MKSHLTSKYTNNKQHQTIYVTHIHKITPQEIGFYLNIEKKKENDSKSR